MYLVLEFAVVVLIVASIAENVSTAPDKVTAHELTLISQSIQSESNAPGYVIGYITGQVEELANVGVTAYKQAGNAKPLEKFQLAGKAILEDPILKMFVESKIWKVTAEVPPGPAPTGGARTDPPFLISISIPEGFHGVVKEAGRLRFECAAKTTAECIPANGLGK